MGKNLKMLKFLSKANVSSGSQEIHRILLNLKAYFRIHTNPPLVAISSKYSWKINGFLRLHVSEYCSLNGRQTLVLSLFARGAHVVKMASARVKYLCFMQFRR